CAVGKRFSPVNFKPQVRRARREGDLSPKALKRYQQKAASYFSVCKVQCELEQVVFHIRGEGVSGKLVVPHFEAHQIKVSLKGFEQFSHRAIEVFIPRLRLWEK